jgi:hypothetical protein
LLDWAILHNLAVNEDPEKAFILAANAAVAGAEAPKNMLTLVSF